MIRFLVLLVLIPVILIIAAFTYRNAASVNIDLFTSEYSIPLAALLLIALLVGIVIGFLANFYIVMRQKNRIRHLIKQRETLGRLSDVFKSEK